ncbi:MAG TPA: acetyltransferase [Chitinophagales bacterium]|nr:acetyltransferase [Chitinophagales bacterium]
MADIVIFGIQDFAELAHYYLENDSPHRVVAFSVNEKYIPEDGKFHGLHVLPFEDIEKKMAPGEVSFFAPMSPQKMNQLRTDVYNQIKGKGYEMISYVSSKATMFNNQIGDNCFILEDNTLQPFTNIGNNVVLWSGNHIGHHGHIKDNVTFTSQVVMSGHCTIEPFSFFGVNATIRDGITIAEGTFVAMAACITKSTEAWSMYKGNPAVKSENYSTKNM